MNSKFISEIWSPSPDLPLSFTSPNTPTSVTPIEATQPS